MIVLALAMGFVALACAFPQTALGRQARRWFVEAPAQWLAAATGRQIVLGVIGGLILAILCVGAPEIAPFLAAADLSLFLDVTLIGLTLALSARLGTVGRLLVRRLPRAVRVRLRSRRLAGGRRRGQVRRKRPAANDDEPRIIVEGIAA